jgi:hypothetical protein
MQSDSSKVKDRDPASPAPAYRTRAFWLAMALCAILYLPSLFWALGLDQNIFAEIGSLLLSGHRPYVDAWDVKPPNIYYIYALFEWIFGQHDIAIRIADYLTGLATCAAAFVIVRRRLSMFGASDALQLHAPIVTALLLVLTLLSLGLADTAQTESFAIFFIILSIGLTTQASRDSDKPGGLSYIAAGVAIGIATFFKTTNAIFLLPLIVEFGIKYRAKAIRPVLLLVAGFAGWCALQVGVLAIEGNLYEYLRISAAVFLHHPHEVSPLMPVDLLRSLWTLVDIWCVIAVAALGYAIVKRDKLFLRTVRLPLAYLLAGLLVVYIQNKGWGYHYVIVLPGLVSLCAISAIYLYREILSRSRWVAWTLALLSIAVTLGLSPSAHRRIHNVRDAVLSVRSHDAYLATLGSPHSLYYPRYTHRLASYLADRTDPTDHVWIFGEEPGAYWKSHRLPTSRFIYSLLFTSGVIAPDELQAMNDTLVQQRPAIIVVERFDTLHFRGRPETSESLLASDSAFRPLRHLLQKDYGVIDTVCDNFIIYRRR